MKSASTQEITESALQAMNTFQASEVAEALLMSCSCCWRYPEASELASLVWSLVPRLRTAENRDVISISSIWSDTC